MGRKIPARKHKGVKDPEKQNALKFASLKNKINHPPTDPDDQAIPRRFLELQQLIIRAKEGKKMKRPAKTHKDKELIDTTKFREKEVVLHGMRRPEKPVPVFKQLPGEQGHQFVHRIQMKCQEVINECNFEDKFNVNVKRNVDTGEVEKITKVSKDDVAFLRDLKPHGKQREKSRSAGKRDKRKEKKADKLKAKQERNVDEFARFKDEVKFGETVHEPPQLTVLPRKSSRIDEGRPGRRDLLLKGLLPSETKAVQRPSLFDKPAGHTKNKKKKELVPAAEKRRKEAQRVEVVQAYRTLKAKQAKAANATRGGKTWKQGSADTM